MNAIPAFCIMNEKGGMVGVKGKDDGKEAVAWFTDPGEAKALLAVMREHNPGVELRKPVAFEPRPPISCSHRWAEPMLLRLLAELGVHGLGTAFRICRGWREGAGAATELQSESEQAFAGALRLQGNIPLSKETAPRLQEMLAEAVRRPQSRDPWRVPSLLMDVTLGVATRAGDRQG